MAQSVAAGAMSRTRRDSDGSIRRTCGLKVFPISSDYSGVLRDFVYFAQARAFPSQFSFRKIEGVGGGALAILACGIRIEKKRAQAGGFAAFVSQ